MPRLLLLDSNVLSKVVRPDLDENRPVAATINHLAADSHFEICVPEIIDYELRRKLLHLTHRPHHPRKWAQDALVLLDRWVALSYAALTTETMRLAAKIWAQTRAKGELRSPEVSLDIDAILAAQATQTGGAIITTNEKHFRNIADVFDWTSVLNSLSS
ncbi:MAG TPA: PIN domain-containing protein [Thermoanaerobaculia bacterium]|nr:PIN domain-containing protein [Thermoanaerobaculia bacterium]